MSSHPGLVFKDLHPEDAENRDPRTSINAQGKQQQSTASDTPSRSGLYFKDLHSILPTPEANHGNLDEHGRANALQEEPTMSHSLANRDPHSTMAGAAQVDNNGLDGSEVRDLGWSSAQAANPLIGGLSNEEVWMLVRRFNKQTYHVKETTKPVPGGLDMNVADEDEFSPDKLRSSVERAYITVIITLIGFGKHIVRLRSWREQRRTTWFLAAYSIAWILDMIMPLILTTLIVLIVYPPSRQVLFPPAPIALVGKDGAPQKPKAGVLGSHDSATGAPENFKGEAVEQEASHFVNGIAHVALSSAAGKHPADDPKDGEGGPHDSAPDPTAVAVSAASARAAAQPGQVSHKDDKAKVPMQTAMWNKMRPILHGINDVSDTFERFGNALSPVPPFPRDAARLRLAGVIAPLLAVSLVTSSYMFTKGMTFGVGFGFFGDPVIQKGIAWLNRNYPHWEKLLELRNTLLKGVPTNAQLCLTLLRIGEANHAPIPPPPRGDGAAPSQPAEMTDEHLDSAGADAPLGASQAEIAAAASHSPSTAHETDGSDIHASKEAKHGKKGGRILGFFKSTIRTGVETAIGADRLKAKAGSEAAKGRLGAVPNKSRVELESGPVDFRARYNGKKGHVYISTRATIPCVSFTTKNDAVDAVAEAVVKEDEKLHPVWSVAVADISEVKKVGGFGWKTRLVVGWALDREVADGLEIVERTGTVWKVTACPLRDELFNRLVAIGGQKWESW